MNNRVKIAHEFANAINSDRIVRIILFGSVARGDDSEDSDIDILIISNHREDIEQKIDDEIAWIMYDKQELISAHIMDEKFFNETKHFSFLTTVLEEGVAIG
jgi:predicted nucleotidyltransferase